METKFALLCVCVCGRFRLVLLARFSSPLPPPPAAGLLPFCKRAHALSPIWRSSRKKGRPGYGWGDKTLLCSRFSQGRNLFHPTTDYSPLTHTSNTRMLPISLSPQQSEVPVPFGNSMGPQLLGEDNSQVRPDLCVSRVIPGDLCCSSMCAV